MATRPRTAGAPAPPSEDLLILGLGNVLCGDDGVGVRVVEELHERYEMPERVRALDGGTLGLALLSWVAESPRLLLVDAVRASEPAGTLVRLSGDDVAPAARERLSVHQVGVSDLLDGLRLLDRSPSEMVLLGLVPQTLELGTELSAPVEERLEELVEAVVAECAAQGYPLSEREADGGDRPGTATAGRLWGG